MEERNSIEPLYLVEEEKWPEKWNNEKGFNGIKRKKVWNEEDNEQKVFICGCCDEIRGGANTLTMKMKWRRMEDGREVKMVWGETEEKKRESEG